MFIDKKGRLFGKVSIIDILIVAIILAGSYGLYIKFGKSTNIIDSTPKDNIRIIFAVTDVMESMANNIRIGDVVKIAKTDIILGELVDMSTDDLLVYGVNTDGKYVSSAKPNYKTMTLVVEGKGSYTNQAVQVDGQELYPYKYTTLAVSRTAVYTRVVSIEKI